MKIEINGEVFDTTKSRLANSTTIGDETYETWFCVSEPKAFQVHLDGKGQPGFKPLSKDEANAWLKHVGSPSRIFTDKAEMDAYLAQAKEVKEING